MSFPRRHINLIRNDIRLLDWSHASEETAGNLGASSYPATVKARVGDLFIAHCTSRTSSITPAPPGTFLSLYSDVDSGNFWRTRIMYRVAVGTEVPGAAFNFEFEGNPAITCVKLCSVYLFRGAAIASFNESGGQTNGAGAVTYSACTPSVRRSLALTFHSHVVNAAIPVITGAANGTWERPSAGIGRTGVTTAPQNLYHNMQMAYIDNLNTLSGGSASASLNMSRTFSLKPA